jgi:hypothetical protein
VATCEQLTTADACTARSDCHGVYHDVGCGCLNCCCVVFQSCASGKADCKGPAACDIQAPACNDPACNGQFTTGYTNVCYEGCVRAVDCAP